LRKLLVDFRRVRKEYEDQNTSELLHRVVLENDTHVSEGYDVSIFRVEEEP
jgi:hypothetical protein